ncbi:unnamed protein product [Symbiodinium sp. KB8]|nr:unnamed protein product [Symbiodinium sp. KB8]
MPSSFIFVKEAGDTKLRVVPIESTGMILVMDLMEHCDIREDKDAVKKCLEQLTVGELLAFMEDLNIGSSEPTTNKDEIVEGILSVWDALMFKLDMEIPLTTQRTKEEMGISTPSTVPFSGSGYKLGEDISENEDENKGKVVKLIVRRMGGDTFVIETHEFATIYEVKLALALRLKKKDTLPEHAQMMFAQLSILKTKTGEILNDHANIGVVSGGKPYCEVFMTLKTQAERADHVNAFIISSVLQSYLEDENKDEIFLNEFDKKKHINTAIIKCGDKKVFKFSYGEGETVRDLQNAFCIWGVNVGADKELKLKYLQSASYLQEWEPLHATLQPSSTCELVVCLRAGAPKRGTTKDAKILKVSTAKSNFDKLTQSISRQVVQGAPVLQKAEKSVGMFMATATNDPTKAFENLVKTLPTSELETITNILDDAKISSEHKVRKVALIFLGLGDVANTKETYENVLSAGVSAVSFAFKKMSVETAGMPIIKSIVAKEIYHKQNTDATVSENIKNIALGEFVASVRPAGFRVSGFS